MLTTEMKKCIHCEEAIHPLRVKVLPNTTTCVGCSTEGPKRGRIVTLGSGDHTYNEIEILEEDQYREAVRLEFGEKMIVEDLELQDYDTDEVQDDPNALKAIVDRVLLTGKETDVEVIKESDDEDNGDLIDWDEVDEEEDKEDLIDSDDEE